MMNPKNSSSKPPPATESPNAVEVLERVRSSYQALLERGPLSALDRAVLLAVESALKQLATAG